MNINKLLKRNKSQIYPLLGLFLILTFPVFAGDCNQENEPIPPQIYAIKLEPLVFRLAPSGHKNTKSILTLSLVSDNPYHLNKSFSPAQVKDKIPSKIGKEAPKKTNRLENFLYTTSLLTLTALNIADYISTVRALQLPGLEEGNPILRPFTKNVLLFSAVKIGITFFDFYLLKKIYKKKQSCWLGSFHRCQFCHVVHRHQQHPQNPISYGAIMMSTYLSYYLEMQKKQSPGKKLPSLEEIKSNYIQYLLDLTKNDLEETAKILDVPKASLLKKIQK